LVSKLNGEAMNNLAKPNLENSIDNYISVYCINSLCKKTYGYINPDNSNFYVFDKEGGKVNPDFTNLIDKSVSEEDGCSDENIGKFNKNRSAICIKAKKSVKFSDSDIELMIIGGKVGIFKSEDEINGYALISGKNYIVGDPYIEMGNFFFLFVKY